MSKTKICYIITKLELGGAQQSTIYSADHLNREKFSVVLISGKGGILDKEATALDDTKIYLTSLLKRSINPFFDILALIKLYIILKKEKPQIVHTHSSKAGIIGRWAAFFARVPFIIHTFHGFGFHDFQFLPKKIFFTLLEKLTAKISDRLVVISYENMKKALERNIGEPKKYVLIRCGINIQRFKNVRIDKNLKRNELNLKPEDKVITTIGPLKPQKNLKDFVLVANKIRKIKPECKFLIVGDGEQRQLLTGLIKDSNLETSVILLGWRKDVEEILAISDIFVLTSLWEGLPCAILEAMSSSLPVIANSVDGVKEIIINDETGFLCEPLNIDNMYEKLLNLTNDYMLSKRFGKRAQEVINGQFDINLMVKQLEELYQSLTKK